MPLLSDNEKFQWIFKRGLENFTSHL